jgi:hypothetical protein
MNNRDQNNFSTLAAIAVLFLLLLATFGTAAVIAAAPDGPPACKGGAPQ